MSETNKSRAFRVYIMYVKIGKKNRQKKMIVEQKAPAYYLVIKIPDHQVHAGLR